MRNRLRNGIYSITNPFIMTRFLHTVVNPFRRIPPGVIAALWCCFLIGQTIPALAQERTVQGRVLSEDRVGFPGVNIIVKGTAQGTVTDADGNYSIAVSSVNDVLVFSSIGYETVEVVVGNRSTIDVDMVVDVKQLDEVVVVGYGTVKKSDVTGSLVSVTSDVIKERPVQNVLQALQGRAAGMHVTSNFKPGELPVVRIRGNRSLNASNDPLYVVDGIPLISGNISDINPNDIASIEVLKDASATAIYGSRGANGVVLITTNKGAKGKVSVNVNSTYSLDSYHSLTDWMNGGQYIDRWRESLMNGGLYSTAQFTDLNTPVIRGYPDPDEDISRMQLSQDPVAMESVLMGYEWEDFIGGTVRMRNTTAEEQAMGWPAQVPVYNSANIRSFDWIDQVTRQGITQSHQISLTSGTESSRLYLSLGYYDQLGVQRDQDYERFNTTVSGDITANNWLTLGASLIGSFSLQNFGFMGPNTSNTGSKDLYSRATEQFPYARNAGGNLSLWNPIIDIDQTKNERRATSLMASLYAEIKFTPWLKYRMNFGPQFRHFRNGSWTGPDATSHLTNRPNTAGYTRTEDFSWVLENLLYADKTFGDHTIGVTLLQSSQESRQERIATSVTSTIYDISYWYDLAANLNGVPGSYGTGFTSNTLMSWMGRINYSFRDKYLLTASGRFDGASVLAEGHKWHFFPSLAVAWKLHEEEFMSFANAISELKPRFGFGVTGNSSVSPYTTTGPLSRNPYVFGSTPAIGYLPQLVRNPELEWEKTSQWNIGLDFGLFQNRLRGSLEIYDAKTNDLIMRKTLPAVSGYVEKLENVGKTRNRGIEITLSSVNIEKGDFTWTMDVNWSRNKEEIVELLSGKEDMLAQRWFIGQPLQVYYQYENAGIWQNTAEDLEEMAKFNAKGHRFHPGTIKVVDQNGDYVITADDMVIRGSDRPKWTGGITNTFRYKNWTLSSFIYARVGQTYFGGYPNSYGGVWPNGRVENDVWSWDNPGGKWPMPNFGNVENITAAMQYHDGSFYAVRNIAVSFDFPGSMIDRFKINSLQLSAQVVNPFIFGGDMVRMGINPDDETNWQIASSNTNPLGGMNNNTILPQSFVFGLRASF
jgi:TonB-linked SusC/RagA family outer membrane protein